MSPETEKNCANSESVSGNVTDIECGKQKDEESSSTENDADFECKRVDEQHKRCKLLEPLKEIILNPLTSDLNLSNEDQSILIETLKKNDRFFDFFRRK